VAARAELQQATTAGNAARLVDTLDQSKPAPDARSGPVSQPLAGSKFALMNAYLYATTASSVQQILHTLDVELPCIAYGFFANRERGLLSHWPLIARDGASRTELRRASHPAGDDWPVGLRPAFGPDEPSSSFPVTAAC
jgi:hypothetical protein